MVKWWPHHSHLFSSSICLRYSVSTFVSFVHFMRACASLSRYDSSDVKVQLVLSAFFLQANRTLVSWYKNGVKGNDWQTSSVLMSTKQCPFLWTIESQLHPQCMTEQICHIHSHACFYGHSGCYFWPLCANPEDASPVGWDDTLFMSTETKTKWNM